ncbi:hypothetical protein ACQEU6_39965 [Spirillospora sp. CA-108201]
MSADLAGRVCPCAAAVAGRVYPVARPAGPVDDVFSAALVREVGDVLEVAGFPPVEDDSPDWYALSWCLWRFVYGYGGRGRHSAGTADAAGPDGGDGADGGGDQVSLW